MRLPFVHPSRRRLADWLDAGATGRLSRHVETCERCTVTLEQLTELDRVPADLLRKLLAPRVGIEQRILERAKSDLGDREAVAVFIDLFGSGWETAQLIFGDRDEAADG